jgi:hypothetical protein
MKGVDPKAVTAKVAEPQPASREASGERSGRQRDSRRNTNRQRGRVRAMSVLANAKSDRHRKPYEVEPGDLARKFTSLTRGDLRSESPGEVSRGRSSVEAPRKWGGAKGQRTTERAPAFGLRVSGGQASETEGRGNCGHYPSGGRKAWPVDPVTAADAEAESEPIRAKGGGSRCSMK